MRAKIESIVIFIFLLSACGSEHSFSDPEFPVRQTTVGGNIYRYRVYLPANIKPGEKLPVMLYLHGSNRRGDDNQSQLQDISSVIRSNPDRFSFIIVFPQCRKDTFWPGPMMEQAIAALDQTVKEFAGDESRLYLAGYSMGGFGVWQTAITNSNKFAALVPVAGGVEPMGEISPEDRALLSPQVTAAAAAPDPYRAYAEALAKTPVWIVHGAKDETIPVDASRKIAASLKAAGDPDVNYTELEGVGHDSVMRAFSEPRLFEWLKKRRRSM